MSDFLLKLERSAIESKVATLDENELVILKIISSCTDPKLVERFLKEENPTKDDLIRVIRVYEMGKTYASALQHNGAAANFTSQNNRNRANGSAKQK